MAVVDVAAADVCSAFRPLVEASAVAVAVAVAAAGAPDAATTTSVAAHAAATDAAAAAAAAVRDGGQRRLWSRCCDLLAMVPEISVLSVASAIVVAISAWAVAYSVAWP